MKRDEERAWDTLTRLVKLRPRTEAEVMTRLSSKGYPPEVVQGTLQRGRQVGLLDDQLFARMYAEDRLWTRPCSRRLVVEELRRRGIAEELAYTAAQNALPDVDEAELASRALRNRLPLWAGLAEEVVGRRAAAFLLRRGFSPDTARRVMGCHEEREC